MMKHFLFYVILFLSFNTIYPKIEKALVTEFVKKSGSEIFGKEYGRFCVLIASKNSDDYDDYLDELTKSAKKFVDKAKFVIINTDIEENWQIIEFFGIIAEDIPSVLFIELDHDLIKYKAEIDEIIEGNISLFVQDCLNGNNKPFRKSDEIPENWSQKLVKQLVGKNFNEVVFNRKQITTFVLFYAPWCAACQKIMPEIEELGERFKETKDVIIARMDSISNEVAGIPIIDVPIIALFVKGSTKPIYYVDDARTADDFANFIASNLKTDGVMKKEENNEKNKKVENVKKAKNEKSKTGEKMAFEKMKDGNTKKRTEENKNAKKNENKRPRQNDEL